MSDDQHDPDLEAVHERAMHRMDAIWAACKEERALALDDRKFGLVPGHQWKGQNTPTDGEDQDAGAGPPRMEISKFIRPIRRLEGDYRASRKSVDFRPKGDSDRASADNLDGLYRADENDSPGGGQHAFDNGFTEGVYGGFGGWMLHADYEDEEDEENEHQRIRISPVYDADQSLFFDVNAKAQDKSDAKHAFLLYTMTREAFEDEFPDATPATFGEKLAWDYEWVGTDTITLATYYEIEDASVARVTMRQTILDGIPLPDDAEPDEQVYDEDALNERRDGTTLRAELRAKGYRQVKRRRIKRQRVHKYTLSGAEVLEDEGLIAGGSIPLIPFYAERAYVDGVERSRGLIRLVKDAVIINNLVVSNLAESASGPTSRIPVFAPQQIDKKLAEDWANYRVERPALLQALPLYSADGETVIAAGPATWVEPDQIQPATGALVTMMGGTIDELMGFVPEAERVPANTSAQAIELVNDRGDANDFLWHDNFALALQRTGEVWLGMARELYVEQGREMVSLDMEGKQSTVVIAEPKHDDQGQYLANDLSSGRYDVIVDVGPATKTRRDAVAKSMINIADSYQQIGNTDNANAALGIAVLSMDGEGVDGFRNAIRKQLVAGEWVEPNEEEKAALAAAQENQQPDANVLLAQAQMVAAQAEVEKAATGRLEAETRRLVAVAQAEKARADAAAALAGIDRAERAQILAEVTAATKSDREDAALQLKEVEAETKSDRDDDRLTHEIIKSERESTDGATA